MPFGDGATIGDWAASRVVAGEVVPDLSTVGNVFGSMGPRGVVSNPMFWLFVLRCYGKNAGGPLGAERLAALAYCAGADVDTRSLARYLASMPPDFEAKCRQDLSNLHTPSLLPPQC